MVPVCTTVCPVGNTLCPVSGTVYPSGGTVCPVGDIVCLVSGSVCPVDDCVQLTMNTNHCMHNMARQLKRHKCGKEGCSANIS